MATDTQTATALLDEATAIVEAEYMRLHQEEEDLWCEVADLFAEMPAPRPRPRRTGVTIERPRTGQPLPANRRRWPPRGWPPRKIWASQRSPP